ALALAREISGMIGLTVLVAGTDGTDGPTNAAGGLISGATWREDGARALKRADAGRFLEDHNALFTTGPTGTNVMDLLIALKT
ncbi:MAG: MOFRL family protein, partial [Rhodobacteraceae bacterium]|nr:MOFRL family protein [Paracoccaceae bacterium]